MQKKTIYIVLFLLAFMSSRAQYITEVPEYKPAPGQYINVAPWGFPGSTHSLIGGINGSLSLGSFGGYVVFRFENPVENDPDNPYGVDFTIFGNPITDWSEPGIVWVMKDENENGLPDDTWYELAGSEYFFSSTKKKYEVTYQNPKQATATDVPWTDKLGNTGTIVANEYHGNPYYPLADSFTTIPSEEYTLNGTFIDQKIEKPNPFTTNSYRKAFGYADNQYRGSAPFTLPDNPYTPGVENSGGDAFDIDWAVDENGQYISLDKIHFVKVQSATLVNSGMLGELSTEITGAVDVPPDNTVSGPSKLIVLKNLPDTINTNNYQLEAFAFENGRLINGAVINWEISLNGTSVNDENLLTFTASGKTMITASLQGNPEISTSDSTVLVLNNSTSYAIKQINKIKAYPNPASDMLFIEGIKNAKIEIYNIRGNRLFIIENGTQSQAVSVSHLPPGFYVLKVSTAKSILSKRFVKK
ncbi:MAG: T9SS type A sorting domain-containing protein [Prolixibacteraceae bacterium]|nr:T9SS type A sorting domain-containing protein [Prolixibacteraceae bacterium]